MVSCGATGKQEERSGGYRSRFRRLKLLEAAKSRFQSPSLVLRLCNRNRARPSSPERREDKCTEDSEVPR